MISSSCLPVPHLFEVSALRILCVCFALMKVKFMYCKNVNFVSKVIPRVFECFVVGGV